MKFSTFHLFPQNPADKPAKKIYDEQMQIIRWLDELGFDSVWVAEHHFRDYGLVPNSMLLLASVASMTKHLRLGNAVVIMPFHHPLRMAEDAAMVDVISGGRLEFGFGRGYQGVEFAGFDISVDNTRERTDEALEIVLKAWEGEPFSYEGQHYQVDNVRITPSPIQKPIPVHVASIGPDSIAHYGSKGIPFMVDSTVKLDVLREKIQQWKDVASEHGHDAGNADIVVMRSVYLGETNQAAYDYVTSRGDSKFDAYNAQGTPVTPDQVYAYQGSPRDPKTGELGKGYEYWKKGFAGRDSTEFRSNSEESWNERWVAGDIDRVCRKVEELEAMGVTNIMWGMSTFDLLGRDEKEAYATLERFAREVVEPFSRTGAKKG